MSKTFKQETAEERLTAAVNSVEKALRGVVRVADPEVLDEQALRKIEAFVASRLGDMMRDLGLMAASKGRGKGFSLDAPPEAFDAPRSVLTVRPNFSVPRLGPGLAGTEPPPLTPEQLAAYEQRRQHGGRLVGGPKITNPEDDEDGVGFIDTDED